MLFNSYNYVLLLLPLTFLLHQCFKNTKWQNFVLLTASYTFYVWGSHFLIVLIVFSSAVDYYVGLGLARTENQTKRNWLLFVSLFLNLSLLAAFKYSYWFISGMNAFLLSFGIDTGIKPVQLPLPPGISFYTFQTLSYTIDVYRRQFPPHKDPLSFLTYVAFFPQLIAGPIERCSTLLPQLEHTRQKVSSDKIESGIFLIAWGLFKKVVFADNLGHVVAQSLERMETVPGIGYVAVFCFSFQIYCDFSAYTDIARGSARLFGIELSRNFWTPYFAQSPSDFWRRWHLTLSQWLRDYLYLPMGGNQRGILITIRNLVVTMFLAGLWHGAGTFFILWGLYHGLLLVFYRIVPIDKFLNRMFGAAGRWIAILVMFHFTLFGWILFMSDPSSRFPLIMNNFSMIFSSPWNPELVIWIYPTLLFTLPVIFTELLAFNRKIEFVDLYEKIPFWGRVALYYSIFYIICFLGKREAYDFIYFAF